MIRATARRSITSSRRSLQPPAVPSHRRDDPCGRSPFHHIVTTIRANARRSITSSRRSLRTLTVPSHRRDDPCERSPFHHIVATIRANARRSIPRRDVTGDTEAKRPFFGTGDTNFPKFLSRKLSRFPTVRNFAIKSRT
jgi:hypothetical protein